MNKDIKNTVDGRLSDIGISDDFQAGLMRKMSAKGRRPSRPMAAMAAGCICVVLTASAFAANAVQSSESDFYLRYLSTEQMAVADASAEQYGAEVYFKGLRSDDMYSQYFSINKLIEYYGDDEVRTKAIDVISPFLENDNEKISDAAAFALSVLTKTFDNPNIYKLEDGSALFTLFNGYSDYGSYNELWMIRDDELSKFFSFDRPSMYITSITLSPDKRNFAVTTGSNKSTYLVVFDLENGTISPDLIGSARIRLSRDKGYEEWQQIDSESYCDLTGAVKWLDNSTVEFYASLYCDDLTVLENAIVTYNIITKDMDYRQ